MIKEVEKLQMDAPTRARKGKTVKLDSLRDEHQRTLTENSDLKKELIEWRRRAEELEQQCASFRDEKDSLGADLRRAQESNDKMAAEAMESASKSNDEGKDGGGGAGDSGGGGGGGGGGATSDRAVQALRDELAAAKAVLEARGVDLNAARREALKSVTQSVQFRQLRAMLQRKNEQLEGARQRLLTYEPDETELTTERDMK